MLAQGMAAGQMTILPVAASGHRQLYGAPAAHLHPQTVPHGHGRGIAHRRGGHQAKDGAGPRWHC